MPKTQTMQQKERSFNLTPHSGEDCATSSYKEPKRDKTFNSTSPYRARNAGGLDFTVINYICLQSYPVTGNETFEFVLPIPLLPILQSCPAERGIQST
jgi:hypothetical protein